jgi:hypothetical protein
MNKKIITVLAAAAMLTVITSCGGNNSSSQKNSNTPASSSSQRSDGWSTSYDLSDAQQAYLTKINTTWKLPTLTNAYNSAYASMMEITPDLSDYDTSYVYDATKSKNVSLSMSVNYDKNTGMKYTGDTDYTTPSGKNVKKGDFKPVYQQLQSDLNFTITDVTSTTDKAVNDFKSYWGSTLTADIACGNVSDIVDKSVKGNETILDLAEYLNKMPNFTKFLQQNPSVLTSILTTKNPTAGSDSSVGIYYLPYFDGYDDLEKMTMLRADYVRKLLDGDYNEADWDTDSTIWTDSKYQPTITEAYSVKTPVSLTSNETKTITKSIDGNGSNIIAQQNALAAGERTSAKMVKQFRDYIDARYGNQYEKRSDLFLGVDASYDADEMIALMRLVKVSPYGLTGSHDSVMVSFVPREYNNQRIADLYRWAGHLWGVRGMESRSGYLYVGKDGKIHDARGDEATANMLNYLNEIYGEGLILQDFESSTGYGVSNGKFAENIVVDKGSTQTYHGFMEYDYAQTQGVWNDKSTVDGYDFRPILNAEAKWDDGEGTTYYQFTESWRSVKTQAWCLNADLKNDQDKLEKALAVVDYFFSDAGHNLNSFGPESMGYTSGTIDYQGKEIPAFTQAALDQLNDTAIGGGSYTNYLRKYVGATLPIGYVKEQGMEYQATSEKAKYGLSIINKAIEVGTFKHVKLDSVEDGYDFFKIVPSSFMLSTSQVEVKTNLEGDTTLGSINSSNSTTKYCIWDKIVMNGNWTND